MGYHTLIASVEICNFFSSGEKAISCCSDEGDEKGPNDNKQLKREEDDKRYVCLIFTDKGRGSARFYEADTCARDHVPNPFHANENSQCFHFFRKEKKLNA